MAPFGSEQASLETIVFADKVDNFVSHATIYSAGSQILTSNWQKGTKRSRRNWKRPVVFAVCSSTIPSQWERCILVTVRLRSANWATIQAFHNAFSMECMVARRDYNIVVFADHFLRNYSDPFITPTKHNVHLSSSSCSIRHKLIQERSSSAPRANSKNDGSTTMVQMHRTLKSIPNPA